MKRLRGNNSKQSHLKLTVVFSEVNLSVAILNGCNRLDEEIISVRETILEWSQDRPIWQRDTLGRFV